MSKVIIVEGCRYCPYSCHTDDFDNYSGFKCTNINSNVGWGEEEFVNMDDDFVDAKCPLSDYNERRRGMTREEQIREASIDYQLSTNPRAIGGDAFADFAREMNVNPSFIAGVKWAEKKFAKKVQIYSITHKYIPDLAIKPHMVKEMIYDRLLTRLIEGLKRDGFIEIKETREGDESTISMCINVLKNDFRTKTE